MWYSVQYIVPNRQTRSLGSRPPSSCCTTLFPFYTLWNWGGSTEEKGEGGTHKKSTSPSSSSDTIRPLSPSLRRRRDGNFFSSLPPTATDAGDSARRDLVGSGGGGDRGEGGSLELGQKGQSAFLSHLFVPFFAPSLLSHRALCKVTAGFSPTLARPTGRESEKKKEKKRKKKPYYTHSFHSTSTFFLPPPGARTDVYGRALAGSDSVPS